MNIYKPCYQESGTALRIWQILIHLILIIQPAVGAVMTSPADVTCPKSELAGGGAELTGSRLAQSPSAHHRSILPPVHLL